jgi:hypothetical protein
MADSGVQFFLHGENYYRQLDELVINLCVARTISDADWIEYLEGTLRLARKIGRMPRAAMVNFSKAHLNAGQRRMTADFLAKNQVTPVRSLALLTDSTVLRGVMMAFGWMVPNTSRRAFRPDDVHACLRWLRLGAVFDEKQAGAAWSEARATFALKVGSASVAYAESNTVEGDPTQE